MKRPDHPSVAVYNRFTDGSDNQLLLARFRTGREWRGDELRV